MRSRRLRAAKGPDGKVTFAPREIDGESGIGTQFTVLDVATSNKKGVLLLEQARPAK